MTKMLRAVARAIIRILDRIYAFGTERTETAARAVPSGVRKIAVVRLDGIGDYLLMHDFLRAVKHSSRFAPCHLTFIGRTDFKELAESIDSDAVDEFIWIDTRQWYDVWRRGRYQRDLFADLSQREYDTVISPNHLRDTDFTETVLAKLKAKEIIGCDGPATRVTRPIPGLYSRLIDTGDEMMFEYDRNRRFFGEVLGTSFPPGSPTLDYGFDLRRRHVAIAPFAGDPRRKWDIAHYRVLVERLVERGESCLILGGSLKERRAVDGMIAALPADKRNGVVNLCARLPLSAVPFVLACCTKVLVANDTGTVHLAAAVGCPFVVVSNGRSYLKFQPYPGLEDRYVYPPAFRDLLKSGKTDDFYWESNLDINAITPEDVLCRVETEL